MDAVVLGNMYGSMRVKFDAVLLVNMSNCMGDD